MRASASTDHSASLTARGFSSAAGEAVMVSSCSMLTNIAQLCAARYAGCAFAAAAACCSRATGRSRIGQWIAAANRPSAIEIHHMVS